MTGPIWEVAVVDCVARQSVKQSKNEKTSTQSKHEETMSLLILKDLDEQGW